jgi:hypothetical protein
MRIHTNTLTATDVIDALAAEKAAGRIASHVSFRALAKHGSRSHVRAIEIQLEAEYRDSGRRAGNSGSYGPMQPEYNGYAATYDEWGWLLAALFRLDGQMIVGTARHPIYQGKHDFDERTAMTYAPTALMYVIARTGDPFPIVTGQAAHTKRGYLLGRRGANRVRTQPSYWPGVERPRTVAEVAEFARIEVPA